MPRLVKTLLSGFAMPTVQRAGLHRRHERTLLGQAKVKHDTIETAKRVLLADTEVRTVGIFGSPCSTRRSSIAGRPFRAHASGLLQRLSDLAKYVLNVGNVERDQRVS
jgi:hypothetical protein